MLQAKLKNGKRVTPASLPQKELQKLKKEHPQFYCPVCGEQVILRAGEKVIAHFAHRQNADCITIGGGEGAYHEQGKLALYQWLTAQGLEAELEVYLPEINQRPDLLLQVKKRRIAIEYQCSRISPEEITERTDGYRQAGIHVIWILGERLMKRTGTNTLTADTFTQTMMHQFSPDYPLSLFYFCPITFRVIKFQDLTFIRQQRAAGALTVRPLCEMTFPDLLAAQFLNPHDHLRIWQREKKQFRVRVKSRQFGSALDWQYWLYGKGLHQEQLPSIVHLPVKSAYRIKLPSWIWQSRLALDVLVPLPVGGTFTLARCKYVVQEKLQPAKHFPLIQSMDDPILDYLNLLSSLDIIEPFDSQTFKKLKPIPIHQELELALQGDTMLLKQLFLEKVRKR
jgi:competence CoiA-like predicted nuclease